MTRYVLYVTLDIGEEVIDIDTPPKKKKRAANWAAAYFFTKTLKGYMVYQYSEGSKNCIDVVFHKGGIPSKRTHPVMSLDQGGKALKVEWKLSKHLFMDKQVMVQAIPKDSARYNGYADTPDRIHQAGVMPIDKFYQGPLKGLPSTGNARATRSPIAGVYSPTRWYTTSAKTTYSSISCM